MSLFEAALAVGFFGLCLGWLLRRRLPHRQRHRWMYSVAAVWCFVASSTLLSQAKTFGHLILFALGGLGYLGARYLVPRMRDRMVSRFILGLLSAVGLGFVYFKDQLPVAMYLGLGVSAGVLAFLALQSEDEAMLLSSAGVVRRKGQGPPSRRKNPPPRRPSPPS